MFFWSLAIVFTVASLSSPLNYSVYKYVHVWLLFLNESHEYFQIAMAYIITAATTATVISIGV